MWGYTSSNGIKRLDGSLTEVVRKVGKKRPGSIDREMRSFVQDTLINLSISKVSESQSQEELIPTNSLEKRMRENSVMTPE